MKIGAARRHARILARPSKGRKQDADEDGDDGDNNKEFDEREGMNAAKRRAARFHRRFLPHDKPLFSGNGRFGGWEGEAPGLKREKKK
jgi:hypothetical protein